MDHEQELPGFLVRVQTGSELPGVTALNVGLRATTDHKSKSRGFRDGMLLPWPRGLIDSRILVFLPLVLMPVDSRTLEELWPN